MEGEAAEKPIAGHICTSINEKREQRSTKADTHRAHNGHVRTHVPDIMIPMRCAHTQTANGAK